MTITIRVVGGPYVCYDIIANFVVTIIREVKLVPPVRAIALWVDSNNCFTVAVVVRLIVDEADVDPSGFSTKATAILSLMECPNP